jgi:RecA/RadA recombinase
MARPKKQLQPTQEVNITLKSDGISMPSDMKDFSKDLIKDLNKELGSAVMFNLGDGNAPTVVHRWVSTGSKQLDYIIGNIPTIGGGLPEGRIIELQGPTGCHGKGDKVLMYDGSVKNIEDVLVGDKLIGPDSEPRTVLSLHRGKDSMFEYKPTRYGKTYHVTGNHTLVFNKGGKQIQEIVNEWIKHSKGYQDSCTVVKSKEITFNNNKKEKIIPPYILGLLLGDGYLNDRRIELTTADQEIEQEYTSFINSLGYKISVHPKKDNKAKGLYHITGTKNNLPISSTNQDKDVLRSELTRLGLLNTKSGNKFIPVDYKISSSKDRLELLAGLIDTDGYSTKTNYEYTSKSLTLVEDVLFVLRSVGLRASIPSIKIINGENYYRIIIGGDELDQIPCRLPRKQIKEHKIDKKSNSSRFSLKHIGDGVDYYGITVDKDNLYLGEDFTVIKNCGKSHIAALAAKNCQSMGGLVVYVDTENATSPENLARLGVDVKKNFAFAQCSCTEDVFKIIESTILKARQITADIPILVVWDSVANTSPKAELEGDYDQNTIGLQARVLGKGFRKITNLIGNQHVILLALQQQREKIGCVSPETIVEYQQGGN